MPRIERIPGVGLSKKDAKEIAPWAKYFRKIDGVWTGYESGDDFGLACLPDSWNLIKFHPSGLVMLGGNYAPSKEDVLRSLDSNCPRATPRDKSGCVGDKCDLYDNGPCHGYRG